MKDDNYKIDEMEQGEMELDMLTAVDFNLEDTMGVPTVDGEEDA